MERLSESLLRIAGELNGLQQGYRDSGQSDAANETRDLMTTAMKIVDELGPILVLDGLRHAMKCAEDRTEVGRAQRLLIGQTIRQVEFETDSIGKLFPLYDQPGLLSVARRLQDSLRGIRDELRRVQP
ncbi:MAG: hypothetical protein DMF84_30265 [Acidobacteria bacterium]|nr:MAG: hypothetical protein DMF84_30265 [Acidobacteriota bacterium]